MKPNLSLEERLAPASSPAVASFRSQGQQTSKDASAAIIGDIAKLNKTMGMTKAPSGPLGNSSLFLDEISAAETVKKAVRSSKSELDLSQLRTYEETVGKRELQCIDNPQSIERLKILDIHALSLNDEALEPLVHLHLEKLNLGLNKLCDLHALEKMDSLTCLDVSGNPLNKSAFKRIARFQRLEDLNVSGTPITDSDLRLFHGFPRLRHFLLNRTGISYIALRDFKTRLGHYCRFSVGYPPILDASLDKFTAEVDDHNYALTERAIRKQLGIWLQNRSPDKASLGQVYALLGRCIQAQGRAQEAEDAYKKGVEIALSLSLEHLDLTNKNNGLIDYIKIVEAGSKWSDAVQCRLRYEQLFEKQEHTLSSLMSDWQHFRATNFSGLGRDYLQLRNYVKAAESYARAAQLFETADEQLWADASDNLVAEAQVLNDMKDLKGAKVCLLKAQLLAQRRKDLSVSKMAALDKCFAERIGEMDALRHAKR